MARSQKPASRSAKSSATGPVRNISEVASSRLTTEGTTWAMSRWVITKRASGYTSSSASSERMWAGDFSRQGRGGYFHRRSLSTRSWYR